ncbi:hypothetical protein BH09VER1_BH09VER1_47320 [soil metagenome]
MDDFDPRIPRLVTTGPKHLFHKLGATKIKRCPLLIDSGDPHAVDSNFGCFFHDTHKGTSEFCFGVGYFFRRFNIAAKSESI